MKSFLHNQATVFWKQTKIILANVLGPTYVCSIYVYRTCRINQFFKKNHIMVYCKMFLGQVNNLLEIDLNISGKQFFIDNHILAICIAIFWKQNQNISGRCVRAYFRPLYLFIVKFHEENKPVSTTETYFGQLQCTECTSIFWKQNQNISGKRVLAYFRLVYLQFVECHERRTGTAEYNQFTTSL